MTAFKRGRWGSIWRELSGLDRAALIAVILYIFEWGIGRLGGKPSGGLLGSLSTLLAILFFFSIAYLGFRSLRWVRVRLLWSLRNRLVVAYLFIAVVPVLLLLTMAGLVSYLAYMQLGAHLLVDDINDRSREVTSVAEDAAGIVAHEPAPTAARTVNSSEVPVPSSLGVLQKAARENLPGLLIAVRTRAARTEEEKREAAGHTARLIQRGDRIWLESSIDTSSAAGQPVIVTASVQVTTEFLDSTDPELGPIQLALTQPTSEARPNALAITSGDQKFVLGRQISTRRRVLGPPANWLDFSVTGVTTLVADRPDLDPRGTVTSPVLASFSLRPSKLNQRLFTSLGELRGLLVVVLVVVGVIFVILEVAALITGVNLTRTITSAVADLYGATQRVKTGDFSHRIRTLRKDQLGALGESFNAMTSSISTLLEEQRERQRLANELSIAREVQTQLFPQVLPELPGVRLAAICRAARVVSGDYYDFIQLGPTRIGLALADISGKGISAALLMASLQAALRSQVLLDGAGARNTAELVDRLNRHLFLNTSDDRYATFFYAVYDSTTRTLHYTNAGHVPPFYVVGDQVSKLEEGGTVVGLLPGCTYEQATIQVQPGALLVAYSDGLVEPENVYGEEFGSRRLLNEVLRCRTAAPQRVAEELMASVSNWSGTPEQPDDMTILVARMD